MKNVFSNIDSVLVLCESNYSFFFDFVAKEMAGPKTAPLHRVCSLMRKMKVKCFVREELEENSEIKEELAAVALRAHRKVQAKAIRYTFFRTAPANGSWKALEDTDVLGYVVVLKLEPELPVPAVNPQTTILHAV
jgi:hypothetical protein